MRKEFARTLNELMRKDKDIRLLLGDISVGLFIDEHETLPANIFNMGILEQSMISFAAGMASEGKTTFVHTISSFIIERAYEQIKLDMGYNKNNVILVSANGPYDYNKLGPTHHCPADVPILRQIDNMNISLPGRVADVANSIKSAISSGRPEYIRLTSYAAKIDDTELLEASNRSSESVVILVGEALHFYEHNKLIFANDRVIYVTNPDERLNDKLSNTSKVKIYEPYSCPITAYNLPHHVSVEAYCYPRSIETGIYDMPHFKKA